MPQCGQTYDLSKFIMADERKKVFDIIKAQQKSVCDGLKALENAKKGIEMIEELAVNRASGQMLDIKELVTAAIRTKEEITKVMVNLIESQMMDKPVEEKLTPCAKE